MGINKNNRSKGEKEKMNAITGLLLKNLVEMGGTSFIPTIKVTHGMNYRGVQAKVMQKLDQKDHSLIAKFKIWNAIPYIEKLNTEMESRDFYGKEIKKIFGHDFCFEFSDSKAYITYVKPIRKFSNDNIEEAVYLRKMAQKSMKLLELTYVYIFATLTGNSDLISYDMPKEDREFMNAFAESCWETLHMMIFPADACPDINEYLTTRNVKKWDKACMVTPEVFSHYQGVIVKLMNQISPNGDFRVVKNIDAQIDENTMEFERKTGEHFLYSPIEFTSKKLTAPFTFILGGDSSMEDKDLPEESRNYLKNHVKNPKIQAILDAAEGKKKLIKETVKSKITIGDNSKPDYVKISELITDKYKNAPVDYDNPDAKQMTGLEIKVEDGMLFANVRKNDGTVVTNVIDNGRYAGGERFSVIGTAVRSAINGNPVEIRYPQYVDIEKNPDIALKILLDDRYHLTEEERLRTKERFATPIVYEWFDFVDTGFINNLDNTELAQFFNNCFAVIVKLNRFERGFIPYRLRVVNFIDINNFTVVSDDQCKFEYVKFGINQNSAIMQGLRVEVRNGSIMDNSTKTINEATGMASTPFNTMPETPVQMLNQLQSFNPAVSITSGFMPANGNQEQMIGAIGNGDDGSTVLSDGSFIPNFRVPQPVPVEMPQTPVVSSFSHGVKDNLTYEEAKALLNSPIPEEMFNEIHRKYPEHIIRYQLETKRKFKEPQ